MTQEEKDLLLKDISGRLTYNLICQCCPIEQRENKRNFIARGIDVEKEAILTVNGYYALDCCVPYLRPMKSMTTKEYESIKYEFSFYGASILLTSELYTCGEATDWLNAHHFDYRGLIEKGLALEAPETMYTHFGDMDVDVTVEKKNKI